MAHENGGPHFYLGCHQPAWLARAGVPLFVSDVRLRAYKSLEAGPRARTSWALDSGGFTELSKHGRWTVEPFEYVQRVKAYDLQIGNLDWAAPQDWMCEPWIIAKTGLSVREHQERTVENFVELERLWQFWDAKFTFHSGAESPFMPVLQGWTVVDYFLRTNGPVRASGRAGSATYSSLSVTGHSQCRFALSAPIADSRASFDGLSVLGALSLRPRSGDGDRRSDRHLQRRRFSVLGVIVAGGVGGSVWPRPYRRVVRSLPAGSPAAS
jgi:hypothetical protein